MAVVEARSMLKRRSLAIDAQQPGGRSPRANAVPVVVSAKPTATAASEHWLIVGIVHQPLTSSHSAPVNFLYLSEVVVLELVEVEVEVEVEVDVEVLVLGAQLLQNAIRVPIAVDDSRSELKRRLSAVAGE